ncbi:HigA family addiction module antitoxin [Nitrosovibrio sp. Nv6]|uniref:HigA family addiction module antitoxin n=1 Tax=Nitrosovibrio sp. Nv6 TaxID=1855340 RepID=UPI0008B60FA1|nr:HigA family addiction module antitoxin [Nitrosovibrio sp. Nv6]SEO99364.1 addiction module antidote protein, HigA family [Nitrosovibrio sp. Nv6]
MKNLTEPIHPGEILADELEAIGMTAAALAVRIGVPKNRLYEIINEQRGVTADTAMRLGVFFGTGPNLWLNLQKSYELDVARQKIGDNLKAIKPYDRNAVTPA